MKHPVFSPVPRQLVPRPANGTYSAPGGIGEVLSWAQREAAAQLRLWAQSQDAHARAVIAATIASYPTFDQVGDVGSIYTLDADQAKAVNLATPAAAFLGNDTLPADGLDGNGNAIGYDAWRWNVAHYRIADDSLLQGYYAAANFNLSRGWTGEKGAVA